MKKATGNLEIDHEYILRLIGVMEKMVQVKSKNTDHFDKVVHVIKKYADGIHHAKEETLLFPLMAENGFSMKQGPLAVMLFDHNEGRAYVKGMVESITKYKEGNESALSKIYDNMLGYSDLLRNHIAKENNMLFRMADNALSENDHQNLLMEFEKVETSNSYGGKISDYIYEIEKLESIYQ
jgi:hemerythrin-like domain-containing protein